MGVEEEIGLGFRGWGAVQDFGCDVGGAGEADEGAANVGDEYLWVCKVYTRVCIHACVRTCIYTHKHTHTNVHTRVCTHAIECTYTLNADLWSSAIHYTRWRHVPISRKQRKTCVKFNTGLGL